MPQFGRNHTATSVTLCTALFCLSLTGCQNDARPPGWGDFQPDTSQADAGDTDQQPASQVFVPDERPEDTYCEQGWCWVHPRPFPNDVDELGEVDGQIYGWLEGAYQGSVPFIWGDEFQLLDVPSSVTAAGSILDVSVGESAWLALGIDGKVHEFGPDGVRDQYQLPQDEHAALDAHSISTFIVGTTNGGGYIRRGGEAVAADDLPRELEGTRIWPNGEVWQISESMPTDVPNSELRRWFSTTTAAESNPSPLADAAFGPDPTSACGKRGIWTTLDDGNFYGWGSNSNDWSQLHSAASAPDIQWVTDLTCQEDRDLYAGTGSGDVFRFRDGNWTNIVEDAVHSLNAATSAENTAYFGGRNGTLLEVTDSGIERRGGRLMPVGVPGGLMGFSDLWVSPDESSAMLMDANGIHRLTPEGYEDVTPDDGPEGLEFGHIRTNEVWGLDEPEFAVTDTRVLRWTGSNWEESSLTADRDAFDPVDIAGHAEDDVLLATKQSLFHYDGNRWKHVITEEDAPEITRVTPAPGGGYLMARIGVVVRLGISDGIPRTHSTRVSPCESIGDMYLSNSGDLWVAGQRLCVARYDDDRWTTFEPAEGSELGGTGPTSGGPLGPWNFFAQPGSERPLVGSIVGVLEPTSNGRLRRTGPGNIVGAAYLPGANISVAAAYSGILVKYH